VTLALAPARRPRSLAVGNAVMTCLGAVMTSGFFFLSL